MTRPTQREQLKIQIYADAEKASVAAAEMFAETIRSDRRVVWGLATGGTPIKTYDELIRMHREDGLDFSAVETFNLDEYVGLPGDHPQSYRFFMQTHLFDHVNIDPERTHVPDGQAVDLQAHARDYERSIKESGGIDLQLLGIGHNGHIAFNEPRSPRDCRTRVVGLTEQTIEKNSRFFDSIDEVPHQAVTMGIGTILEARRIVMLAFGPGKAEAVWRAVEEEATARHPASWLQTHPDVTFVLDKEAASRLA